MAQEDHENQADNIRRSKNGLKQISREVPELRVEDIVVGSQAHQRLALPLHLMVVAILGILALVSVAGGIVAIIWNSMSNTEFHLFGARFTTGSVGVAFVGIGLLTILFAVRSVLNSQYKLAALPPDQVKKARQRRKK